MNSNYSIPTEFLTAGRKLYPNENVKPTVLLLEKNDENFFFDFPTNWKETLDNAFERIYYNFKNKYSFSFIVCRDEKMYCIDETMIGHDFKDYLLALLKVHKTTSIFINDGSEVANYIVCRA